MGGEAKQLLAKRKRDLFNLFLMRRKENNNRVKGGRCSLGFT